MRHPLLSLTLLGVLASVPAAHGQDLAKESKAIPMIAASEVSVSASPSSVFRGTPVTITADVQPLQGGPQPTGTVNFYECHGTYLGTATLKNNEASITAPTYNIAAGNYTVKAVYSGDADYFGSTSSKCAPVTVMPQGNSTSDMAASPSSIYPGGVVTLATDVSPNQGGPIPTGYVNFYTSSGTQLGSAPLVSGVATLNVQTYPSLPPGVYHVVSVYQGSSIYEPSTSETDTITVIAP